MRMNRLSATIIRMIKKMDAVKSRHDHLEAKYQGGFITKDEYQNQLVFTFVEEFGAVKSAEMLDLVDAS